MARREMLQTQVKLMSRGISFRSQQESEKSVEDVSIELPIRSFFHPFT